MYTVVLMTAITAGSATPDFGRNGIRGRLGYSCAGCYGCVGSCYGCGGCYGYSSGCYGYGGCYGSCYGNVSGCCGCQGSSCHGCHGSAATTYGCTGGAGCAGCHGCFGGSTFQSHATDADSKKTMPKTEPPKSRPKTSEDDDDTVQLVHAQIVMDIPADAKLYVDGQAMKPGSGRRVFQTPNLQPGQTYFYDIRVEIVRDGQTFGDSQRVILRPGQQVTTSFAHLERQAEGSATVQVGGR